MVNMKHRVLNIVELKEYETHKKNYKIQLAEAVKLSEMLVKQCNTKIKKF